MSTLSQRFMLSLTWSLLLGLSAGCGGQMAIAFGRGGQAPPPPVQAQGECAQRRIEVGRAQVSYNSTRYFSFVYGHIATTAKSGLVFYRGGARLTVPEVLEELPDKKLRDLYSIRMGQAAARGPDEKLVGIYWLVTGVVGTLLISPLFFAPAYVDDDLGKALLGTGIGLFLLTGLPSLVIGGLLIRDGNNDIALGRIMRQVLLSPDLEPRALDAVRAYNARVCGGAAPTGPQPGVGGAPDSSGQAGSAASPRPASTERPGSGPGDRPAGGE